MAQFAKLTGQNRNLGTFCKICLLQGCHRPSLRNFWTKNENKLLGHFIDLGLFDMSDMAYSDRQSRCLITNGNQGEEKAH